MTQIHGNLTSRDRLDDSTARRMRLLHDLERQWLDTWGQAHQLQIQASFPLEASEAVADASASIQSGTSAADSGGASIRASSHAAGPATFEIAHADTQIMLSSRSPQPGSAEKATPDLLAQRAGMSASAAGTGDQMLGLVSAAVGSQRLALDAQGAGTAPVIDAPTLPGGIRGGAEARMPLSKPTAEPVVRCDTDSGTPIQVRQALESSASQDGITSRHGPASAIYPEQASSAASSAAVSTLSELAPLVAFKSGSQGLLSSAGEREAAQATRPPRQFSAVSLDIEPADQHLMLRELNDQEVLASMRDAQLGSHESQAAAQELARALMQAGYARVQVVVNGHQRKHGAPPAEGAATGDAGQTAESAPQATSSIQPTHHGN